MLEERTAAAASSSEVKLSYTRLSPQLITADEEVEASFADNPEQSKVFKA